MKTRLQYWPCPLKLSPGFRASSMVALLLISGCALLHKRLPYHDPDRLVSVVKVKSAGEEPVLDTDFLAWRNQSKTLGPIAAYVYGGFTMAGKSEPERIPSALVSTDFFTALGVQPVLGRVFLSEECQSGKNHVVVISYDLWLRSFDRDPNLIGKTITLDNEKHTVIGVMPEDFRFPNDRDAWAPLAFDDEGLRLESKSNGLEVIARLKPSVTIEQAQADMSAIAGKLEREYPAPNSSRDIKVIPLSERLEQKKGLKMKIILSVTPTAETGKGK